MFAQIVPTFTHLP